MHKEENFDGVDLFIFCYAQDDHGTLNRLYDYYGWVIDYEMPPDGVSQPKKAIKFLMECKNDLSQEAQSNAYPERRDIIYEKEKKDE